MELQKCHFDKLWEASRSYRRDKDEEPGARTGAGWVKSLALPSKLRPPGIAEHTSKPNREELFDLVADGRQDTRTLCAVILAWGGMRVKNGQQIFAQVNQWCGAADRVRKGKLTRTAAYDLFHGLRLEGRLPGMGPAFFTKLVFFLRGRNVKDPGYIMDQWTSCSVNLLSEEPSVVLMNATYIWDKQGKLRSDFQVSDQNDECRYERFCAVVDHVAEKVDLPQIDAELLLMSRGKGKGAWRRHVLNHRRAPGT